MPVLFIPNTTDESTNKLDILDAALEPFIRDCINLFVNGVEVDYGYPIELVHGVSTLSSRFTLRCMLVIFSGDHPAQCKFAGFNTRRKCHRHPPRARSIQELHDSALQIARCETSAQRKEITRRSRVVSKTRAWRLVDGLGLDLSRDLTFDVMHVLALCLFKKYIELLRKDTMDSPQRKSALSRAMADVTTAKPSSITGRWPRDIFTRIGYFKAEECSKFMLYCVPHILHEVRYHPDDALHQLGALLVQIARMFYLLHRSHQGWTMGMLESCRSMLASWRIRSEELLGPNSSILEHVAGSKRIRACPLDRRMKVYLTRYWREKLGSTEGAEITYISDHIVQLKSLIIRGKVFKPGDHVIVLDESRNDLTYDWNWKGRIVNCFYHSCRWLYNKTESGQQTVDPISGMQILHPVEPSEAYGNWRPARQLGFHFFPVRRHGDGDILALETEEWMDRGFLFGPSGVGVPPPHPELHDVMLACHVDECGSSVLDYCVVRMVFAREDEANASQLLAGTENLLEDIADVTDQTSAEQAGGEVQVQWIRQNGTGSWVMRPGACCSTISFRHLRKLCDNFTSLHTLVTNPANGLADEMLSNTAENEAEWIACPLSSEFTCLNMFLFL
ncbi:hypothetical protein R1sor_018481 [Riccia sorocarpa]|uniref:Uncharacterized protein n=1 Tax=Riccia sorocarpa TaxID=122646 RepID=A0ABD3IG17_9MARC